MIDNLGGRLGSFDRLEKELSPGRRWSGFDRAIGAGAFFADRGSESPSESDAGPATLVYDAREAA
jgi:3'-5' exoribonuclease